MAVTVAAWLANGREENEWDYVLSHIKPDARFVMGKHACTHNVLRDAPVVSTAADLPNDPLVLVVPLSARNFTPDTALQDFTHPTDAVYMFGPNSEHITEDDMGGRVPDHIVYIPTDTKDEMFNYVACIVTLWHRRYG